MLKLIAFISLTYAGIKAVQCCLCDVARSHDCLPDGDRSYVINTRKAMYGGAEYSTNFVYTDVHQASQ